MSQPGALSTDAVCVQDCPGASKALASLDYPPVAAVTVAYPMSAIQQDRLDAAGQLPGQLPDHLAPRSLASLVCTAQVYRGTHNRPVVWL